MTMLKALTKQKKIILLTALVLLTVCLLYLLPQLNASNYQYFLNKRGTKIIAILLTGFSIGVSALSFQTITNNKLITPNVMGLESLYMFIQTFIIFIWGSKELSMMTSYTQFFLSIGFMMMASWGLFNLVFKKENQDIYRLVLTGMVLGSLFGGLSSFMQVLLDPNEFTILQGKMFASFNNVNVSLLGISCLLILPCSYILIKDRHALNVLSLGRSSSINLGVNYYRLVKRQLMMSAVLISISTALVGPITFLGILVVSLTRKLLNTYRHQEMMIEVTLLSGTFLLAATYLVERVFSFNTTVSVIINFIGGVYFIYLIIKERQK
ncbi:iron chelate uptake ABC transporter family permease subunit [Beduini massiliensis]|uniref:iron chelate uptake ABC transporter family permease subunit n=1 Tax=Beduini massiliensis TaxID=1585974 RepID=UPI000A8F9027|nr:iron chelate uptake ABC transporter family permease subunit [Beduini massiliensis]